MGSCCGGKGVPEKPVASSCCSSAKSNCCESSNGNLSSLASGLEHFDKMINNCYAHATAQHEAGRPVVGIMCEFTPRELIMAGGGVPVCLCGGSATTIPEAEADLPANLCPLIKSTYGYHAARSNPFLEMADVVVAETTCDGKKKMYELMGETRPMFVLELPQRSEDPEGLAQWTRELGRLRNFLEERWGVNICDDRLREAIATLNRERRLRRRLAETMREDSPPLTGSELWKFNSSISGVPADIAQYEAVLRSLDAGEGRKDLGEKARVLVTGVPMVRGAQRVMDLIEEAGGLIVAMESCTGIKPIDEDVDEDLAAQDPLRALAEKYYHLPCSVMTPNEGRMELLRRLADAYRPDCVVELIWQACLTYDVESRRVRRLAEEELGVPYLRIETDYSSGDSARIAVRIEALLETVGAQR